MEEGSRTIAGIARAGRDRASFPFFNLYNHGFVRVAVGIPTVRVADPEYNARETIALMKQAA
ncbi:MAG: hypothetical protein AAB242_10360, partial [Nitrospirota bacterium]